MSVRVAIGPREVAGTSGALAEGLRANGSDAEVVLSFAPRGGYRDAVVLGRAARVAYAARAPFRRDVFHYQHGATWVPRYLDARAARARGRTVVVTYHGDDCRQYDVARGLFPARGRAQGPLPDDEVRARLRAFGKVAHAALVADLELATYVQPFFTRVYVTPLALHAEPGGRTPGDGPPIVLHAPSDPAIKGTARIAAAVEAVAARVPLEYRLLTGVPFGDVARELARADVVVDQLDSVTSGILALEAMQSGVPVLGELDRAALPPYQAELPVVPVTPETLERELESLLRDPERRRRLAAEGKRYVERTHAPARVGVTALRIYAHARTGAPGVYEATADGIRVLPPFPGVAAPRLR